MKHSPNKDISDRQSNSQSAKAALLQAYKNAKAAADLTHATRSSARVALVAAREARRSEREFIKQAELDKLAAVEAARLEAVLAAEHAAAETRAIESQARMASLLGDAAAKKMERDRRYANRKARQA